MSFIDAIPLIQSNGFIINQLNSYPVKEPGSCLGITVIKNEYNGEKNCNVSIATKILSHSQ